MNEDIISIHENLKELFDVENQKTPKFSIPGYQREYSWGKDEIDKLLYTFKDSEDGESIYIGTILLEEYNRENKYH